MKYKPYIHVSTHLHIQPQSVNLFDCVCVSLLSQTGRTALVMAALDGNANVIQTLLSHDAEPCITDVQGRLALHYACIHGHVDSVRAILESKSGLHVSLCI